MTPLRIVPSSSLTATAPRCGSIKSRRSSMACRTGTSRIGSTASRASCCPFSGSPARTPSKSSITSANLFRTFIPWCRRRSISRSNTTDPFPFAQSVNDVKFTLLLAVLLVVLVIFLFLRNAFRHHHAKPALPMAIMGTFAVMYLLGYTIDTLSLLALTLSVGFVVDDAIVMLENIVRHMEMGKKAARGWR